MIDINELRRKISSVDIVDHVDIHANVKPTLTELLDRLEAAEKDIALKEKLIDALGLGLNATAHERDNLRAEVESWKGLAQQFGNELDTMRAKIEAMERQRPVRFVFKSDELDEQIKLATDSAWAETFEVPEGMVALYALPGAQPAPSVSDATWFPVPDKHPTFDPVDLQLADGSVLCGCVPQSDGDYWWEGPSGEVFIDPRYAPVTHWRLSAVPEAKP